VSRAVIVFGGGGFVGGHLCARAMGSGWDVHIGEATVRDAPPGPAWHSVDIRRAADVRALVARVRPHAVVDLAAVADIDRAERERDLASAVNTRAAASIAGACATYGCRFLYLSSDAVFGGTAEHYAEEDATDPVNWYGTTKADGERAVTAACPGAVIVRISLALGFPVADGNSFLAGLEKTLQCGGELSCPTGEIRTPIDVGTLASCVLELCGGDLSGTFHLGSTDSVDRFTLSRRAASLMGFDETRIEPSRATGAEQGRAARHARGVLCVQKARALLATRFLTWEQSLQKAFEERPRKEG